MDFTGQIKHIGEVQQFETKTGSCLSRDIVIETDEIAALLNQQGDERVQEAWQTIDQSNEEGD